MRSDSDVVQRPAHRVTQVVKDRPRRSDSLRHRRATEAIERLHLEMFPQRVVRLFAEERVRVVRQRSREIHECRRLRRFIADEEFRRGDAAQFVEQCRRTDQFRDAEFPRGQVQIGEPVHVLFAVCCGDGNGSCLRRADASP